MRRRLFTVAAAVSAVLCLASCVLWVRSRHVFEVWDWDRGGARHSVGVADGRLFYDRLTAPAAAAARPPGRHHLRPGDEPSAYLVPTWSALGFAVTRTRAGMLAWFDVRVPLWAVAAMAAFGTAASARALRTRGAPAPGLCPACGYDIRATPDRCPECGAVPGPAKGAV